MVELRSIWGIILLFCFICSTPTNYTSGMTSLLVLSSVSEILRLSFLFIQESVCDWASRQIYKTAQWLHLCSVRYTNGNLEKRRAFNYVLFIYFLLECCFKSSRSQRCFLCGVGRSVSLWQTHQQSWTNAVAYALIVSRRHCVQLPPFVNVYQMSPLRRLHPSSMSHSSVAAGLFIFWDLRSSKKNEISYQVWAVQPEKNQEVYMLTVWFWGTDKLASLLASSNTNSIP